MPEARDITLAPGIVRGGGGAQYYKTQENMVHLTGEIAKPNGGTFGYNEIVGYLPEGYLPLRYPGSYHVVLADSYPTMGNRQATAWFINQEGAIRHIGTDNLNLSRLQMIYFDCWYFTEG